MSYAVRIDGLGWRAVSNQGEIGPNEKWADKPPAPTAPMPEVVSAPPQIGKAQADKLIAFLKANPDIVAAAKL